MMLAFGVCFVIGYLLGLLLRPRPPIMWLPSITTAVAPATVELDVTERQ